MRQSCFYGTDVTLVWMALQTSFGIVADRRCVNKADNADRGTRVSLPWTIRAVSMRPAVAIRDDISQRRVSGWRAQRAQNGLTLMGSRF